MLTHNRIITHLVLIFSNLNKAQIYKMPYRGSPYHDFEKVMIYICSNVFKPIEHKEDYVITKPNNENFPFEIGDKKFIQVGEKVIIFETNDTFVNCSSELGFNDIIYPFDSGEENISFLLHLKYFPIQEFKNSTEKDEEQYLEKNEMKTKVLLKMSKIF